MSERQKAIQFVLAAFVGLSVLSNSSMITRAAEPAGDGTEDRQTDDKPAETKRIDLDDGLVLYERREFRDGEVASLIKTYERNGEKIMQEVSVPRAGANLRTYFRDGKELFGEELDSKGHIVSLAILGEDGFPIEFFKRNADGVTVPIRTAKLKGALRAQNFMKKNFVPFVDAVNDGNKQEADRRLDSLIEKIKAGDFDSQGDDGASKTVE